MGTPLRLLIVEDSEADTHLLLRAFEREFETVHRCVETPEALKAALAQSAWDMVLSEYRLPRLSGPEALRITREADPDLPFIFFSGAIGEDIAVEMLKAGAQDFITKKNMARLLPAVKRELQEAELRRQRRRAERFLEVQREITKMFAETDTVDEAAPLVLEAIGECVSSDAAELWVAEDISSGVQRCLSSWHRPGLKIDEFEEVAFSRTFPPDMDLPGRVWTTRQAFSIPDLASDPGFCRARQAARVGLRSAWAFPVRSEGQVIGSVALFSAGECEGSSDLAALMEALGSQIGQFIQRKRIEDALKFTQFAIEKSADAAFWVNSDSTFSYVNDAACRLLGYTRDELMRMGVLDIDPSHTVRAWRDFWRELRQKRAFTRETTLRHRLGHLIPVEIHVNFLEYNGHEYYCAFFQDISNRKKSEDDLLEMNQYLKALMQASPLAIIVVDRDRIVREWNPAAERTFGWMAEEIIGQPLPFVPDDRINEFEAIWDSHQTGKNITNIETKRIKRDGRQIDVSLSVAPYYDSKGDFRGYIRFLTDITERKMLEAQFRQAQKMEAVGKLAGGVAHDFNNLLTVIMGYCEMVLGQRPPEDPLHEPLDQIKKAGERAGTLTRQLLAFSRKQMLRPEVLTLNTLIKDMEKMLRRLIGEDIELLAGLDENLWRVKVDPGQMEQVIMNLIVNARDAMPHGGRLTIETRNVNLDDAFLVSRSYARAGEYVMMAISDNGCGMSREVREHIFEPFYTTKDPEKGTGLGLATVYGIIKQSDGYIEVYSEPGLGSTFKIYIPRVAGEPAAAGPAPVEKGEFSGTETVLLVEDEDGVRVLVRNVLEQYGYKVLEACGGSEALQICQDYNEPIQLIMTDIVMPRMSGRELAEKVSALRPEIKVLYMSGYTDDAIIHHGLLAPDTAFLHKPFNLDDLVKKLRQVLH